MKHIILLWFLLGFVWISKAQQITILDRSNSEPLAGATLSSDDPEVFAIADEDGKTDFNNFIGAEEITIRSLGYETSTLSYYDIKSAGYLVTLEPKSLSLGEVVVSATKWRQNTANVPNKIISISPKEVALINPQTAADLLGISGKVFIQKSQQGGGSPMIRGFATNRLIYTVDGVRMNTAIFRGGNIQNVINIDPFAVERTEVMFGPGSVIYGSDAIGGAMGFNTLTPQLSFTEQTLVRGKALFRYSSANKEKTGHFDINVGWKKWAMVTSVSFWDYDHLKQGSHGPEDYIKDFYVQRQDSADVIITQDDPLLQIPSAYSQFNIMQKLRYRPKPNWYLEYGFHYSTTSPYGRYDRHNRMRNGTARYAIWDYGAQKWMMNNLSISNTENTFLYSRMNLLIAWQSFEESRIDRSLNSNELTSNTEQVEAYSINLDFIRDRRSRNNIFYGLEFVLNDVSSTGMVTDISTASSMRSVSRYPQSKWTSIAAYLSDEFLVNSKFTLQAGLRYNHFILNADFTDNLAFYPLPFSEAKINKGSVTGSIGAVYRPNETWIIKGSFGTAFRSPNVDDIGKIFDSEPGAVVIPNPDLSAEYAYNFDLSIAKVFGERVKLDVTGYYTILQNAMVRRDFQLNGMDSILYDGILSQVQAIQNAAIANVYGIQAGIEIKLPAGFSLSSDINIQHGEEELDDGSTSTSRHAAPIFGMSRLNYKYEFLTLQLYAQYQGERSFEDLPVSEQSKDEIYAKDEEGNNYSPRWYTLNFKAQALINENFSVSAGLENITDQRYRPYSSGISGAGRNFVFSMRVDF